MVSIPGTTTRSVRLPAVTPAQTITLPPLYAWRGCTLTSAWRSPFRRQTRSRPSMCRRQNRLSSENVTVLHCCLFHLTWLRANWRRAALCLWERQGFLAGTRDLSPAAWSQFRMVWTETGMPPAPRCCRIRLVVVGALVKRLLSVVLVISRSSARFVALGLPVRWRSLTSPDAAQRCLILSMDWRLVLNAMATRRLDCPVWSRPSSLARSKFDNFR